MYGSVGKKQRFSGGSVTVQSEFSTVHWKCYYLLHSHKHSSKRWEMCRQVRTCAVRLCICHGYRITGVWGGTGAICASKMETMCNKCRHFNILRGPLPWKKTWVNKDWSLKPDFKVGWIWDGPPEPPFQSCFDSGFLFFPAKRHRGREHKKLWKREGEHPTLKKGAGNNFESGVGPLPHT